MDGGAIRCSRLRRALILERREEQINNKALLLGVRIRQLGLNGVGANFVQGAENKKSRARFFFSSINCREGAARARALPNEI